MSKFYYKRSQSFKPIDIIPRVGIKCAQCDLIFMPQHIEQHLNSHIMPRFLTPNTDTSKAKKLQSQLKLTQDTISLNSQIYQLKGQQYPKAQFIRKTVVAPSQFSQFLIGKQIGQRENGKLKQCEIDKKELSSNFLTFNQKDEIQKLTLTRNIKLDKQSSSIALNPQISVYQLKNNNVVGKRNHIHTHRRVNPFGEQMNDDKGLYSILEFGHYTQNQHLNSQKSDRNLLTVQVRKYRNLNNNFQAINTASKIDIRSTASSRKQNDDSSRKNKDELHLSPTSYQDLTATRAWKGQFGYQLSNSRRYANDHECSDCKGFYCPSCHSTISPQYRPSNLKEVDPKTMLFYKQHVYNKHCQKCSQNH